MTFPISIPTWATKVLVIEQSAHCDWDWLTTFDGYYGGDPTTDHQAVRDTLKQALDYIKNSGTPTMAYVYTFCEVAYLQAFMNDAAVTDDYKLALREYAGKYFFFASGGMTSAENLLVHPEAFIRNYLLGRQWLQQTLGATPANGAVSNQMWIPDDFGHDSQLPVLLQAMGFIGAGFWRIPSQCGVYSNTCNDATASSDAPSDYLQKQVGLDFTWQATDGSRVQAHWLSESYCQGNNEFGLNVTSIGSDWQSQIQDLIDQNTTPVMPTMYMFTPIDCDFCAPYDNGPTIWDQWNELPNEFTYVVQATFDGYMQLVAEATASNPLQVLTPHPAPQSANPPYIPNPYYMGCYASMPRIKRTHYAAVRTLLFAESMNVFLYALAKSNPSFAGASATATSKLAAAWNELVPSTHHDYITGTSPNGSPCGEDVYGDEQVPRLVRSLGEAVVVRDLILHNLSLANNTTQSAAVMIFNGIGMFRTGVIQLAVPPAGGPFNSSTIDGHVYLPIQQEKDGSLLLLAEAPAFGYTTVQLSANAPTQTSQVNTVQTGNSVTMSNGKLTAVVDGTGITSLSRAGGTNCLTGTGNQLRVFTDNGNIYRFGMEIPCPLTEFGWQDNVSFVAQNVTSEHGNLRATTVVTGTLAGYDFTIRYDLFAEDTALRISVTGAAPGSNVCVMTYFQFASAATALTFGTTSHWDTLEPRVYFEKPLPGQMTFEATHDYVGAVNANGALAGAIYHEATPAWGIYGDGIIGCLLRNTPLKGQNAACASDTGTHIVSYAVTPPDGLQSPENGARTEGSMLAAALHVNNPMFALATSGGGTLLSASSVALSTDERAIVTAAKMGDVNPDQLILRLYQPTNAPLDAVQVTCSELFGSDLLATAVTALEQPSTQNLNISTNGQTLTLDLPYAITSVALEL